MSVKATLIVLIAIILSACGESVNRSSEPKMSEKAKLLYDKAESKVSDLEERVNQLGVGTDREVFISVLSDAKKHN